MMMRHIASVVVSIFMIQVLQTVTVEGADKMNKKSVDMPFNGPDVLSMKAFKKYEVDQTMLAIKQMRSVGSEFFYCLKMSIWSNTETDTTFLRDLDFFTKREPNQHKTKYSAIMTSFEGLEDKAIFKIELQYPKSTDVLLDVSFSSKPHKYILSMVCIKWTKGEPCKAKDSIVLLKVPQSETPLENLPMKDIQKDMRANLGWDFDQNTDSFDTEVIYNTCCMKQKVSYSPCK